MYWPETAFGRLVILLILSPILVTYTLYMFLKDTVITLYDWCEWILVASVGWVMQGESEGKYTTKFQRRIEKLKESEKETK